MERDTSETAFIFRYHLELSMVKVLNASRIKEKFLLSQTVSEITLLHACVFADARVSLKLIYFQTEFGMLFSPHQRGRSVIGHAKGAQTCTCRVFAGSSFSVGEGVPPSSDAGVTGEVAMSPPPPSVTH